MRTVAGLAETLGRVVLLHWHPRGIMIPRLPSRLAFIKRLTNALPPESLRATAKSREQFLCQGTTLAEYENIPRLILRGADSLCEEGARLIAQGIAQRLGARAPGSLPDKRLSRPNYQWEGLADVFDFNGRFVREWLSGRYPPGAVATNDPPTFIDGARGLITEQLKAEGAGVTLMVTNFEQLVTAHELFVMNQKPPFTGTWEPLFGGGIAVVNGAGSFVGFEYNQRFEIIG